jgi:hypothetical protein
MSRIAYRRVEYPSEILTQPCEVCSVPINVGTVTQRPDIVTREPRNPERERYYEMTDGSAEAGWHYKDLRPPIIRMNPGRPQRFHDATCRQQAHRAKVNPSS